MHILGFNAYHGNASAALISDGRLIAAVEEDDQSGVKYAAGFPYAGYSYCLDAAGITLAEGSHIATRAIPGAPRNETLVRPENAWPCARAGQVLARFVGIPETLDRLLTSRRIRFARNFHRVEHHQAHLASAFFVSPFDQAALPLDRRAG